MARERALEMINPRLRELLDEIRVVGSTAQLYEAEFAERRRKPIPDGNPPRWQVPPSVGLRAVMLVRTLREKRDAMVAAAEDEFILNATEDEQPESAAEQAPETQAEATAQPDRVKPPAPQPKARRADMPTNQARTPAPVQPQPQPEKAKGRDPAHAA